MAIEENETQEFNLSELIDTIERDDLPTNEFTTEDTDPMVILGKMNEVIRYLSQINELITDSDDTAHQALNDAIQAMSDASQALIVANGIDGKATLALSNSQTALNTANSADGKADTAISTANSADGKADTAISTANSADGKADTAISTANGAKSTAEGIDSKATTALNNSSSAVETANQAISKAQDALDQVVGGLGTKIYRGSQLLSSLDIKPIEDDIADNTTAITALQNGKVDKVTGKQLSTEDFTTALLNKLNSLYNYDDTQVQADITALQNGKVDKVTGKQLSTEDFTTALLNKLNSLYNYDDTQVQADITALQNNKLNINDLLNKIYPVGSVYISVSKTSPASVVGGTWTALNEGYALWTTTTANTGGTKISAGLPNITGTFCGGDSDYRSGAFVSSVGNGSKVGSGSAQFRTFTFNASASNSIYGNSDTVQPPAIKVYAWKRIS